MDERAFFERIEIDDEEITGHTLAAPFPELAAPEPWEAEEATQAVPPLAVARRARGRATVAS